MDIKPQILSATVMHKRLFPKVNKFSYKVYYLALPLPSIEINSSLISFDKKDLGYQDGLDPENYAKNILSEYGLEAKVHNIVLITMPKILGYIFNPVSFYFCLNNDNSLIAVISEVHNTFGERHSYICNHPSHETIKSDEWIEAQKLFHVSPFLDRSGKYRFRFLNEKQKIGIWIDYFDKENKKQLITSLTGTLSPLNRSSLNKAFWTHPLVTLKTIFMIHWQAIKLLLKGIKYIPKPSQYEQRTSQSNNIIKTKSGLKYDKQQNS